MAESAFAVNVPEAEPYVGSLRERLDPSAKLGVPAHVTLLYPFLPPERIDAAVLGSAALALASASPFKFRLARIGRFPGVAYLAPEPAAPFIALTTSLVRRFPTHLPYEGRHEAIVPHLTVAQGSDAASEEAGAMLAHALPREGIEATCREVVLIENSSGVWRPMHSFLLSLALRPAREADLAFALDVETRTMREYASATWGSWMEKQARERGRAHLLAERMTVIELDGERAGIQVVERAPDQVRLLQLFILPEHQRKGIGTRLVQRLIAETKESRLPLRLRVLQVNPARVFYSRLGFRVVDRTAEHVYMERTA